MTTLISTEQALRLKTRERSEIESLTAEFLKNGGKINVVGASESVYLDYREFMTVQRRTEKKQRPLHEALAKALTKTKRQQVH